MSESKKIDYPLMTELSPSVEMVPKYKLDATLMVLKTREAELLALKGPCSDRECVLHYAHSGPHFDE